MYYLLKPPSLISLLFHMVSKKQTPWTEKEKYRETQSRLIIINVFKFRYSLLFFISLTAWLLLLFFFFPITNHTKQQQQHKTINNNNNNNKLPFSVYVYNLPPMFNTNLLKDCENLNVYTNMCPHIANHGLGQPISNSWFATHQFIAEMIFHARMENHPLRTWDPSRANLFYVPFYGGLHASSKFREANLTVRDELAVELVEFLQLQPWFQRNHGKDHFMVLGRTAWDFMRVTNGVDFGATTLLNLPCVQNMSVLTVERNPWNGLNQHGLPYPSYFHPSTSDQVVTWQNKMRKTKRRHLFSFIGAPRKGVEKAAIRDELIKQCNESTQCNLVTCGKDGGSSKCYKPIEVIKIMSESEFCLQAPGDSFTRRSTFDSILAGCIPVFFSPHTAYTQYKWFLPEDTREYSVYINGDDEGMKKKKIEDKLLKISSERVKRMRSKVIELIPSVTYKHPNYSSNSDDDDESFEFKDVVDVALGALAKHVESMLGKVEPSDINS